MNVTAAKQQLIKHGVGKMVKFSETNDKSFRGKIVSVGETSVMMQDGAKPSMEIPFSQVAGVHNAGLSMGTTTTLIVLCGVVIVVMILAAVLVARSHIPATISISTQTGAMR